MPGSTNWRLVLRYLIVAVYVPTGVTIGFGILVALTGTARFAHIEQIGYTIGGSSLVLVFARLASRDASSARQNVTTLALLWFLIIAVASLAGGGWRLPGLWVAGIGVTGGLLALAAVLGLRWARRWARWVGARTRVRLEDGPVPPGGDHPVDAVPR